jgi:hypothetical protein
MGIELNERGEYELAEPPIEMEISEEEQVERFKMSPVEHEEEIEVAEEEDKDDPTALKSQLQELQARLDSSKTEDRIAQGFDKLSTTLGNIVQPPKPEKTGPSQEEIQKEIEEAKNKIRAEFFDDPVTATEKIQELNLKYQVGPAFASLQSEIKALKSQLDQKTMETDETSKFVISKYGSEIKKLTDSGVLYSQAVQQVAGQHITEILDERVKQAVESKKNPPKPRNMSPTNSGGRSDMAEAQKSDKQPKKIVVHPSRMKEIEKEATILGVSAEARIRWLHRNKPEELKARR